jgi:hypothetical protein
MKRRIPFAFLLLIFFTGSAWPKLKQDEQAYFNEQFHGVLEQIQDLSKQVQTITTRLAEVNQTEAQLQEALVKQQKSLQDMEQLVSSMRLSNEENLNIIKMALSQMRAETQKSLSALAGKPTEATAVGTATAGGPVSPASQTAQAYITIVEGNNVVIDQGSAKGLHVGSRLTFYKPNDPNTRAGVLEVTQIVDAGNSHAKIISLSAGARPEFGDIVRVE